MRKKLTLYWKEKNACALYKNVISGKSQNELGVADIDNKIRNAERKIHIGRR